jgi:hypothetical protein
MDFTVGCAFCKGGTHLPYEKPVRVHDCRGWHCPNCLNHVGLRENDLRMLGPR